MTWWVEVEPVKRVLESELGIAVAAFPEFWKQQKTLSELTLYAHPQLWPTFRIDEVLKAGDATEIWERARVQFIRRGKDDPWCVIAVWDRGKSGHSHFYPRTTPGIMHETINSIPKQFASYLERRGIVQQTTMPDTGSDSADGFEHILQDIRNRFYDLPVILCSAYDTYKEDPKSIAADYYVVKSFDLSELKTMIKRALDTHLPP